MEETRLHELSSPTLADQAYDALREAIISGELASGEKITERGLAARLAVSPTPVREALRRLEQDQLVLRSGPRTVQVAAFHDDRAAEIRMVEGALRAVAARLAASNASPDLFPQLSSPTNETLVPGRYVMWARDPATARLGERTVVKVGEGKKELLLDLPVPATPPR